MPKIRINRRTALALILLLALGVVLLLVWYLNGENGQDSNTLSKAIARHIESFVSDNFPVNSNDTFWNITLNLILREVGHFIEYMFIGAFLGAFIVLLSRRIWLTVLITGLSGPVLGYLDELRQGMVDGRVPSTADVFHDSIGVFLGLTVVCAVYALISYILKLKKRIKELEIKQNET